MGITTRLVRIFKADIHGVMDQLEDKGLLLKQYLRDMENALSEKETGLRKITVARALAQQESEDYVLEIEKLEQDLTVALKKDRDDIARLLVKKIIPLKKLRNVVQQHIDNLDREIAAVKDDIDQQREIASEMLLKLGYTVATAASGEEAVSYLKNQSADLLVLDMIMDSGMDGLETYRKILSFRPGQKAIIASGFSETDRVKDAQRLGAGTYVKKPYTLEKIGLAVRAELEN